jgi:hypothetical protein
MYYAGVTSGLTFHIEQTNAGFTFEHGGSKFLHIRKDWNGGLSNIEMSEDGIYLGGPIPAAGGGVSWGFSPSQKDTLLNCRVSGVLMITSDISQAQTFEIYGLDSGANYERLTFITAAGDYTITPEAGGTGTLRELNIGNVGKVTFTEISDPAAPSTNTGELYMRDNGGGKTEIVARFPTGAIQVIATEP